MMMVDRSVASELRKGKAEVILIFEGGGVSLPAECVKKRGRRRREHKGAFVVWVAHWPIGAIVGRVTHAEFFLNDRCLRAREIKQSFEAIHQMDIMWAFFLDEDGG